MCIKSAPILGCFFVGVLSCWGKTAKGINTFIYLVVARGVPGNNLLLGLDSGVVLVSEASPALVRQTPTGTGELVEELAAQGVLRLKPRALPSELSTGGERADGQRHHDADEEPGELEVHQPDDEHDGDQDHEASVLDVLVLEVLLGFVPSDRR